MAKVVCEPSHEEGEGWSHVAALGKNVPGREKNQGEALPGVSREAGGHVGRVVSMGEQGGRPGRRESRRMRLMKGPKHLTFC